MKKNRKINRIIIHCTATHMNAKVHNIIAFWKDIKEWKHNGYHILIDQFGSIHYIEDINTIANGAKGYNTNSIHVAYIGGIDYCGRTKDTRTFGQKKSLKSIISLLKAIYPNAEVLGHRDLPDVKKECPCFNVKEEYKHII